MSFSRGGRFQTIKSCAPPPGAYDPKLQVRIPTATMTKSDRFRQKDEHLPGPGAFTGELDSTVLSSFSTSTRRGLGSSTPSIHGSVSSRKKRELHGPVPTFDVYSLDASELNKELDQCHRQIEEMEAQIELLRNELDSARLRASSIEKDDRVLCTLKQEVQELRRKLHETTEALKLEEEKGLETGKEITILKKQLDEKQREGEALDENLKSILNKYTALEDSLADMKDSQAESELELKRQLLARRQSLDCARSHLEEIKETNLTLIQTMDEHVEGKKQLTSEKAAIAEELQKVLEEKHTLQKELDELRQTTADEINGDQSLIDHLYGDKVEGDQAIQELESRLHEKELLLADNLKRVVDLKQRLAEKDSAIMDIVLQKSVVDKTLAETNDEIILKSETIEKMLSEKADLEIQVQNMELILLEKEQALYYQDTRIADVSCHLADIQEELQRKNQELRGLKVELEQVELESDERQAQVSDLQAHIDIFRGDLEEKETHIAELKLRLVELEFAVEAKANEFSDLKDSSCKEMTKMRTDKNAFEKEMHKRLADFEKRVDGLIENKNHLAEQLVESHVEMKGIETAMLKLKIESDVGRLEAEEEILNLRKERTSLIADLESLKMRILSLSNRNKHLEENIDSLQTKIDTLIGEKSTLKYTLVEKDQLMEHYVIENNGLMNSMVKLNEELEHTQERTIETANRLHELTEKVTSLEEIKAKQDVEIQNSNEKISFLEKEKSELENRNGQLSRDVEILETEKEEAVAKIIGLERSLSDKFQLAAAIESRTQELKMLNASYHDRLEAAKRDSEENVRKIEGMEAMLEEFKKEKEDIQIRFKSDTESMLAERDQLLRDQQEQYEQMITSLEEQLCVAKQDEDIVNEARRWQAMYEELQAKVKPFKEQLDQFELERIALLNNAKHASHEMEQLGRQYARLLGHQNQKQKIQHVMKLKDENLKLQKDVARLTELDMKARRTIKRLQDDLAVAQSKARFDTSQLFDLEKENPLETPHKLATKEAKNESRSRTPLSARKQAEALQTSGNRI